MNKKKAIGVQILVFLLFIAIATSIGVILEMIDNPSHADEVLKTGGIEILIGFSLFSLPVLISSIIATLLYYNRSGPKLGYVSLAFFLTGLIYIVYGFISGGYNSIFGSLVATPLIFISIILYLTKKVRRVSF